MQRLLLKAFKHSVGLHLIVPLVMFAIGEVVTTRAHNEHMTVEWFRGEFLPRLLFVYAAFFVALLSIFAKESAPHLTDIQALDRRLGKADRCIGLSPTRARDWFEPAGQVYLSRLVAERLKRPAFLQERILVFLTTGDYTDHIRPAGRDHHYAKSLANWHANLGIPLFYVTPQDVAEVIKKLDPDDQKAIGYDVRLPHRLAVWLLRTRGQLAFAVLAHGDKADVIRFRLDAGELHVWAETDATKAGAYKRLATKLASAARDNDRDFRAALLGTPGAPLTFGADSSSS